MTFKSTAVAAAIVLRLACLPLPAQEFRILRHFAGGTNDGSTPLGALIGSGSDLYGMTSRGGGMGEGTVFRIRTDGTGFELLHSFTNALIDGIRPVDSLILSDGTLYGMTSCDGSSSGGTVFKLGTNGAQFTVLRVFTVSDGTRPCGSLLKSGSDLYGLTAYGGWSGKGTAFRIGTDGSGFRLLRTFLGTPADGSYPHGSFVQSGPTLYFVTPAGGYNDMGAVCKMDMDGSTFAVLHHFSAGASDGRYPGETSLVLSGSTLFGKTSAGGSSGMGTIFRVETNGTGFVLLHSFTGGTQGEMPYRSLVLGGSTLYGMTMDYSIPTRGTIFSVQTNGTDFRVLHRFQVWNGRDPIGSLWLQDGTLYGMTPYGGSNDMGVIFALDARPKLSVVPAGTNMAISWSTNFPGFTLEISDQANGEWTTLPVATNYSFTFPVTNTSQFFRLKQ